MHFSAVAFAALGLQLGFLPVENEPDAVLGSWKGIETFQDKSAYDGKTFYLPNNEEIIIERTRVRIYFYPYFKSDEFVAAITPKSIVYTLDRKKVKSDYSFIGDTLVLKMHFINKTFVRLYQRMEMDPSVIGELDQYGFNPSAISNEFELDTLHKDQRKGFTHFDSLGFEPLRYIQFLDDETFRINRMAAASFGKGYQEVQYVLNGEPGYFRVHSIEGTQQFAIVPSSLCGCDSIVLPYIAVSWADRIRQQIAEDQW